MKAIVKNVPGLVPVYRETEWRSAWPWPITLNLPLSATHALSGRWE